MKIENVKEFITNVRERSFDPLVWVGELPNNISPQDKETRMLKGLIKYQSNKLDDIMRVLLTIAENAENLDQVSEERKRKRSLQFIRHLTSKNKLE